MAINPFSGKFFVTHILAASIFGFIAAAVMCHRRQKRKPASVRSHPNILPLLERTVSGRIGTIERFSHYVARQLGFEDANECPQLCKLAYEYLKKPSGFTDEPHADLLYVKLVEEFDRCIFGYFAFYWSQASLTINQALSVNSDHSITKLKNFVMAATRKQRFEKLITKDLKVARVFSTLVEEMKAIGGAALNGESRCTDVMEPIDHSERSPVLLLMGGGMGAGKSTVLKDILKESFWSKAAAKAVIVEADAFKETDVIYRALSSRGHHYDMLHTAELVHQSSTDAASSLLVTALNDGRDVIMDGTLSWEPFMQQTIAMARNVHKCRYRMGVGYKVADDGTVNENYWERVDENEMEGQQTQKEAKRKPYRIELVGVVCDAYLAVVRGIRRAILKGRAVRVNSQLLSHKRFASAFPRYCRLVDNARLYCTNDVDGPPKLIGWKDGENNLLVDPEEIQWLSIVSNLNEDADNIYELYPNPKTINDPGSAWRNLVLSPSRARLQQELNIYIQGIENSYKAGRGVDVQ